MKAKVPLEPIDSRWQFAYYAIACVHFGQPRKRSNGIRCNQRHLALGCTAKLTTSYDRKFQCLVLRNCTLQHNHEIGSAVIKHYASNRKLSMQEQLELNEVLELRPNNKQLKDYIHMKYKKAATLKDMQNMKLSLRKAKASGTRDEQILLDTLEDALTKDSNAKGGIIVNKNDEVATVSFQSGERSILLKNFQRYCW